jgi:hypothetical protein
MTHRRLSSILVAALFLIGLCLTSAITHWFHKRSVLSRSGLSGETKKILDEADHFTLFSIQPGDDPPAGWELLHGYAVLGHAEIHDKKQRNALLTAFYDAVANSNGDVGTCFLPRHAIRAVSGNESVDLVICFQCIQVEIYRPGQSEKKVVPITDSPKSVFDHAVERAGLRKAKE